MLSPGEAVIHTKKDSVSSAKLGVSINMDASSVKDKMLSFEHSNLHVEKAVPVDKVMPSIADEMPSLEDIIVTEQLSAATAHVSPIAEESPDQSDSETESSPNFRTSSERRRARNARFNSWMLQAAERNINAQIKHDEKTAADEELSIRDLLAQNETTPIITDPREYQIELFERAKAQNTIAVLDTGSGKTLIAVLLLRHIIDQELEDRRQGKPDRIAFFMVCLFPQSSVLTLTSAFEGTLRNTGLSTIRSTGKKSRLQCRSLVWCHEVRSVDKAGVGHAPESQQGYSMHSRYLTPVPHALLYHYAPDQSSHLR